MPELVAFIPDCCVIAVVLKFLSLLVFGSSLLFSPSFHFLGPLMPHLQMRSWASRSPAHPPPLGKRSQRCMSLGNEPERKLWGDRYLTMEERGSLSQVRRPAGQEALDLFRLYVCVKEIGGLAQVRKDEWGDGWALNANLNFFSHKEKLSSGKVTSLDPCSRVAGRGGGCPGSGTLDLPPILEWLQ